jgi:lysophospholipase L1-like esterase
MRLEPGSTILFQGDSITDTGRNRDLPQANHGQALGHGYCNQIASTLLRHHPTRNLQFYNRGISGNRVVDLYARWRSDAINLRPSIISILIGVNDTWHHFGSNNGVEVDRYAEVYRMLLEYTRKELPSTHFILCEPFVLPCGVVQNEWQEEMSQRQQIVKTLAADFGADFVPFQKQFDEVSATPAPEYWLGDGVHPTPAGHRLMAESWMETVLGNTPVID